MVVAVGSKIRQSLSHAVIGSSLAGDGLLVRIRSTSIGLMGLVTAVGLGLVAFISQQGWPGVLGGPLPGPSQLSAVGDAITLTHAPPAARSVPGAGPLAGGLHRRAIGGRSHGGVGSGPRHSQHADGPPTGSQPPAGNTTSPPTAPVDQPTAAAPEPAVTSPPPAETGGGAPSSGSGNSQSPASQSKSVAASPGKAKGYGSSKSNGNASSSSKSNASSSGKSAAASVPAAPAPETKEVPVPAAAGESSPAHGNGKSGKADH